MQNHGEQLERSCNSTWQSIYVAPQTITIDGRTMGLYNDLSEQFAPYSRSDTTVNDTTKQDPWIFHSSHARQMYTGMASICHQNFNKFGVVIQPSPSERHSSVIPSNMIPGLDEMTFTSDTTVLMRYDRYYIHVNADGTLVRQSDETTREDLTHEGQISSESEMVDGNKYIHIMD